MTVTRFLFRSFLYDVNETILTEALLIFHFMRCLINEKSGSVKASVPRNRKKENVLIITIHHRMDPLIEQFSESILLYGDTDTK